MIEIVVNGDPHAIEEGQSLTGLLQSLQIDPARVAIELDRRIVKPPDWARTILQSGARLEIVQFVGGG